MHNEITTHLSWHVPLTPLKGGSRLLKAAAVYVDFLWEDHIGHAQRTFQNHKSLAEYIIKSCSNGRAPVLILTTHAARPEGCVTTHPTHDIFIINILNYKRVAKNDAAGAYFAGLQGAKEISANSLNENQIAALLDAICSSENVMEWLNRNPQASSVISASITPTKLNNAPTVQLLSELSTRLDALSGDDADALSQILQSANLPDAVVHAAISAKRQVAVKEFEDQLASDSWNEKQWQAFFKREKWIFGHGLLYHFLEFLGDENYVGGKDLSNTGGKISDYIVRTSGKHASFINLVEIKIPSTQLLGREYRTNVFAIHEDFSGAVSQIIGMCNTWNREGSQQGGNMRRSVVEKWETAQPRGILVVGHTKEISDSPSKQHSFELFRRHLHGIEVLTFDELLSRAQQMITAGSDPVNREIPLAG